MWSTKSLDGAVHCLVIPPNVPLELLFEPLELVDEFYESKSAYEMSDCVQLFIGDFRTCHKQFGGLEDFDEPLLILLSYEEARENVVTVESWLERARAACYVNVGVRGNWNRTNNDSDDSLCG
jgi:hypothetical protein